MLLCYYRCLLAIHEAPRGGTNGQWEPSHICWKCSQNSDSSHLLAAWMLPGMNDIFRPLRILYKCILCLKTSEWTRFEKCYIFKKESIKLIPWSIKLMQFPKWAPCLGLKDLNIWLIPPHASFSRWTESGVKQPLQMVNWRLSWENKWESPNSPLPLSVYNL